ncbi:hypothetical protein EUGRSUZ_C01911 [Eucalyptus grandis]|uniref:Uncharacterized protein n=2 Tax=Eucalyptus grandis TaxID=71139 RepID=A0ACC3LFZ8_EUCGR|nr:hypothetical protein EUGRSUZ_C01911 [Eucalyptus grandis]
MRTEPAELKKYYYRCLLHLFYRRKGKNSRNTFKSQLPGRLDYSNTTLHSFGENLKSLKLIISADNPAGIQQNTDHPVLVKTEPIKHPRALHSKKT